jgi:hypothetical protein
MRYSVAVLLAAGLHAAPAVGQVHSLPSALTLDQTQEAIDWGMGKLKVAGKELNGNQQYQIADYGYDAGAVLLTPFLRVALAAQEAKRADRPFGLADVTDLLADNLCHVAAFRYDRGPRWGSDGPGPPWEAAMERFASVAQVLLMPRGSDDPEKAIQPVWTKAQVNTSRTLAGPKLETVTLIAAFPCEAVTAANDLLVIFARGSGRLTSPQRKPIEERELQKWR